MDTSVHHSRNENYPASCIGASRGVAIITAIDFTTPIAIDKAIIFEEAPTALPVTAPVRRLPYLRRWLRPQQDQCIRNMAAKILFPSTKAKVTPTMRENMPTSPERFSSLRLAP